MLQPTDFKEKQILFIDTRAEEGKSAIRFQNDHIVYTKDEKVVNRASCHKSIWRDMFLDALLQAKEENSIKDIKHLSNISEILISAFTEKEDRKYIKRQITKYKF